MAAKDAAFMWETEALRSSPTPESPRYTDQGIREEGWLTLRETESATGIPISTLRKWVRKEAVPSFIDETADGPIRMLWLQGVEQRAEVLGRPMAEVPKRTVEIDLDEETTTPSTVSAVFANPDENVRPTSSVQPEAPPPVPAPPPEPVAVEPDSPPGTMVVPIEAWDKMLLQLGNLHEAGQQLAEARERAGKAETEARFLRERLAELRAQPQPEPKSPTAAAPVSQPEPASRKRVSIEIEDGESEADYELVSDVEPTVVEEVAIEDDDQTSLTLYSAAVIKHLYGTWRNRPRR
jgi:hypothetical protein